MTTVKQARIPTNAEVDAEIDVLRSILPQLPRANVFRDNIHEAVEAQISVLEGYVEDVDEVASDFGGGAQYTLSAALDACAWLNGEHTESNLYGRWEAMKRSTA